MTGLKAKLAQAALAHVPFDGWSDATLAAAARDIGIDPALARVHMPRGGVDLALTAHRLGDEALRAKAAQSDLSAMRFRERITALVMMRLEAAGDREVVRAASSLLALPHLAAEGASAIWQTADLIWTLAGDSATGFSHYSKRATLSAVYGSTVLYWLGDDSEGAADTRGFLDRRIASVMRFEQAKADLRKNPLTAPLRILSRAVARPQRQ
jgi:ubiquinone biosynthesis protein COQ9